MIRWTRVITYILIGIHFNNYAQLNVKSLNTQDRIDNQYYYIKSDKSIHSNVLPAITFIDTVKKIIDGGIQINTNKFTSSIRPLANLQIGLDQNRNQSTFIYETGIGIDYTLTSKKIFFTAKLLPYLAQTPYFRDSLQKFENIDPGSSRSYGNNIFAQSQIVLAYKPNHIFTFSGGYGKNVFGDGYRSLLLSDNAVAYPFLKLETDFGGIKYVNLYTMWGENSDEPFTRSKDQIKFSAQHYLSWNITKSFNISVFETVIWQSNDTLVNRGFDLNYLNPVVFYRPVEYGLGSSDNVLLGISSSLKINKHSQIYGQLILDEFLLAEIRAKSRWWGNKYGYQIGYKSDDFFVSNLYFQTEFNVVRPFTYSHKYPVISYGHYNASVAHPIGANFYEVLNILSYKWKDFRLTNTMTYAAYGIDSTAVNYGQNIFNSYANRAGDYDQLMLQGDKQNVFTETISLEKKIIPHLNLYLNLSYRLRFVTTSNEQYSQHYFQVGIISRLWNSATDY
ncbi:hypothetical protein [Crocinitomix catalasitica]|uniref:hypothetical protein n=1 Tax=Crocinitomix catalasitica TaxID=184607 RepID=UPI0006846F3C|nr:hypothetical protein [Crocinitomix catalasitica]